MNSQLERIFMKVQKPGRYTGGELNSVVKDPAAMDFRFAFCFPDLYEVGMSHLGMKILYSLYNREQPLLSLLIREMDVLVRLRRLRRMELYCMITGTR